MRGLLKEKCAQSLSVRNAAGQRSIVAANKLFGRCALHSFRLFLRFRGLGARSPVMLASIPRR